MKSPDCAIGLDWLASPSACFTNPESGHRPSAPATSRHHWGKSAEFSPISWHVLLAIRSRIVKSEALLN